MRDVSFVYSTANQFVKFVCPFRQLQDESEAKKKKKKGKGKAKAQSTGKGKVISLNARIIRQ